MKIPHTVPAYAFEAYRCSEETILLPNELNRTIRSENEKWDETGVPSDLKSLAIRVIADNWKKDPVDLESLPTTVDRDNLLEILPLDISFEMAIKNIPYEHYWERLAEARWRFNDPASHSGSWLQLYCERHLSEYLEKLEPAFFDMEGEECMELIELVRDHVRTLELRQLVPLRPPPIPRGPVDTFEDEEEGEPLPKPMRVEEPEVHHIPLDQIFSALPLLREITINIGLISMTDKIDPRDFEFSVEDGVKIGRGVKNLVHLQKFRLTRSNLDRAKAAAILQGLVVNNNLIEIDFSHCKLGDEGAHTVGAFISRKRGRRTGQFRILKLTNNNIGPRGMAGLVRGLLFDADKDDNCDEHEGSILTNLDLRLNPLGDDGANHLAALLLRYAPLEYLNISGCNIGGDGGMAIAEVLSSGRTNFSTLKMDCSNNEFGDIVGEAFEIVAKACIAIIELDVRMCGFLKESEYAITESINRNKAKSKKEAKRSFEDSRRSSSAHRLRRASSLLPPRQFQVFQKPQEPIFVLSTVSMSTVNVVTDLDKSSSGEGEEEDPSSSQIDDFFFNEETK